VRICYIALILLEKTQKLQHSPILSKLLCCSCKDKEPFAPVQGPYATNLLIAGWDEKDGPSLYWMDYLATMHSMNIAGTGYGEPVHL
jgi:20S proteasome alpha/beta subunit